MRSIATVIGLLAAATVCERPARAQVAEPGETSGAIRSIVVMRPQLVPDESVFDACSIVQVVADSVAAAEALAGLEFAGSLNRGCQVVDPDTMSVASLIRLTDLRRIDELTVEVMATRFTRSARQQELYIVRRPSAEYDDSWHVSSITLSDFVVFAKPSSPPPGTVSNSRSRPETVSRLGDRRRVAQVQMDDESHDPLWNGSLYGALAGIPAALLLAGGGTGPDAEDVPGMIVYGALLGGLIGFMVDAAF